MSLYYYKTSNGQRGVRRGSPRLKPVVGHRASTPLRPYDDTSWRQPVLRNAFPQPFVQCFSPVHYDPHNPYQDSFVPYGLQLPMSDLQGSLSHMASPPTPKLTPPLDPTEATNLISHLSLGDPPIPLPAAAGQLHAAVSQAITFFDQFYRSFRRSVGDIKGFGDKDLLNKIWGTQIRSSMVDPTKDWAHQDPNHDSHHGAECLSFVQHQKRVLERHDAFLRAVYPSVPLAAAQVGVSAWPDKELQANQQRHRAAEALKRKVKNGTEDLKNTVGAMTADYEMAKDGDQGAEISQAESDDFQGLLEKGLKLEDDDGNDSDNGGGEGQGGDSYEQ